MLRATIRWSPVSELRSVDELGVDPGALSLRADNTAGLEHAVKLLVRSRRISALHMADCLYMAWEALPAN